LLEVDLLRLHHSVGALLEVATPATLLEGQLPVLLRLELGHHGHADLLLRLRTNNELGRRCGCGLSFVLLLSMQSMEDFFDDAASLGTVRLNSLIFLY